MLLPAALHQNDSVEVVIDGLNDPQFTQKTSPQKMLQQSVPRTLEILQDLWVDGKGVTVGNLRMLPNKKMLASIKILTYPTKIRLACVLNVIDNSFHIKFRGEWVINLKV